MTAIFSGELWQVCLNAGLIAGRRLPCLSFYTLNTQGHPLAVCVFKPDQIPGVQFRKFIVIQEYTLEKTVLEGGPGLDRDLI